MSASRSAPAFRRRTQQDAGPEEKRQPSRFAPAFGRKRKKPDDETEDFQAVPKYAIGSDQPSGDWTTYNASTGEVTYDQQWNAGNRDDGTLWIDRVNRENFNDQFIKDEDLLRNRPSNAFEARNTAVLPVNIDYSKIETTYGTVKIKIDNRIENMNPDGTWRTQGLHGKPKDRIIREFNSRYKERDEEKSFYSGMVDRWEAMPGSAKEQIRQARRDNVRLLMEQFSVVSVPEIPSDYEGPAFEMSALSQALEPDTDTDNASVASTISQTYAPRGNHRPSHRSTSDKRTHREDSWHTEPSLSSVSSVASKPGNRLSTSRTSGARRSQNLSRLQLVQRGVSTPIGSSLATPTTFNLTFRPRIHPGQFAKAPSQAPIPMPEVSWSKFAVTEHPDYIPFEDVSPQVITNPSKTNDEKVNRIIDLNRRKGRVVTVRLADEVTASFSEAICDRLFGGVIQEIQFFPESKHAVLCFLTPVGAAAFLQHVFNTRHNSQHEYRRLQIAAGWYQDNESSAVFPAQQEIARAAVYNKASRVLIVSGIDRGLEVSHLNEFIKAEIGLGRLIVKGRLVVPTKVYERKASLHSNSLILELASIRDAIDVRALINAGQLKKFPHAKAEFYKDPIDAFTVEKEFCDCKYCEKQRNPKSD